jgi:hypothetical protein
MSDSHILDNLPSGPIMRTVSRAKDVQAMDLH